MSYEASSNFGIKICNILKLNPKKVKSIEIRIVPNDCIYVNVGTIMFHDEANQIVELLEEYKLEKTDKTPELTKEENLADTETLG